MAEKEKEGKKKDETKAPKWAWWLLTIISVIIMLVSANLTYNLLAPKAPIQQYQQEIQKTTLILKPGESGKMEIPSYSIFSLRVVGKISPEELEAKRADKTEVKTFGGWKDWDIPHVIYHFKNKKTTGDIVINLYYRTSSKADRV